MGKPGERDQGMAWRTAVAARMQHTGDPAPGFTITLIVLFATLVTVTQIGAILSGNVASVFALVAFAMMLSLLPGLFAPVHGRAAAVCRLTGLGVSLIAVVVLGLHLWG